MVIDRVPDLGPSKLRLRWWFLEGKRFLSGNAPLADSKMTQVPVEASQRVLTQALEEGQNPDVPPHRIRRTPESAIGDRRHRGDGDGRGSSDVGAGGDRGGDRAEPGPAR
ncbi:hypothetical protein PIB30_081932 [Stylosanthes scabra]|uniref:Uncharacterized protein n=1 Tax=Stylosanthes scabra TaxID=79078 RepID=A0ABU6XPX8_9FABA|nr:hypothetical protein [Stylosanthes scabra]